MHEDYFSLAASYFNYQLIQDAGVFNDLLTRKFCSFPTKRVDSFFKNTVVLYLADLRLKQAIESAELTGIRFNPLPIPIEFSDEV